LTRFLNYSYAVGVDARCYFPLAADGKVSKHEAIFHPPLTKKLTIWRYFSSTMDVWRLWLMEN